jgi:hypothetical protein
VEIGRNSAHCIRHICISFPALYVEAGVVSVEDGDLEKLQRCCANLSTLKFSLLSSTVYIYDRSDEQIVEDPKMVAEALELLNTYCKAFTSLQDVIVLMYEVEQSVADHIINEMESHGWKIHRNFYSESAEEGSSSDSGDSN